MLDSKLPPPHTCSLKAKYDTAARLGPVLTAMRRMPALLRSRRKPAVDDIDETLVQGSWKPLVFGSPPPADGAIDRNAYVFCVTSPRDAQPPSSSQLRIDQPL
jgi:hypothetical protein